MRTFDIDSLRIAKPCGISWETMEGDDRKRFCGVCEKHVYNIEGMSEKGVRALIASTNGNFCGRIKRRADGTVVTNDCPKGVIEYGKRISRLAGVALTTVLAAFSVSFGQTTRNEKDGSIPATRTDAVQNEKSDDDLSILRGVVKSSFGELLPGATVSIRNLQTNKKLSFTTDENGSFEIKYLLPGTYKITVYCDGFESKTIEKYKLSAGKTSQVRFKLSLSECTVVVGIFVDDGPYIDMSKTDISTTIRPPE
ncbi:MAG: carboxypeptidase-like regulatory domain-containing protein [Pyrinomonadaceae bacterium]